MPLGESERFPLRAHCFARIALDRLAQERMRQTSFRRFDSHETGAHRFPPVTFFRSAAADGRLSLNAQYDRFLLRAIGPPRPHERCAEVYEIQLQGSRAA